MSNKEDVIEGVKNFNWHSICYLSGSCCRALELEIQGEGHSVSTQAKHREAQRKEVALLNLCCQLFPHAQDFRPEWWCQTSTVALHQDHMGLVGLVVPPQLLARSRICRMGRSLGGIKRRWKGANLLPDCKNMHKKGKGTVKKKNWKWISKYC